MSSGSIIQDADRTARRLLALHGLPHWTVTWREQLPHNCAGRCLRQINTLAFSARIFALNPNMIVEMILHEIAHALTEGDDGEGGHGPAFQAVARSIGCSGLPTLPLKLDPPSPSNNKGLDTSKAVL